MQLINLGKLVNSSMDDRTIPQRRTRECILWGGDCPSKTFLFWVSVMTWILNVGIDSCKDVHLISERGRSEWHKIARRVNDYVCILAGSMVAMVRSNLVSGIILSYCCKPEFYQFWNFWFLFVLVYSNTRSIIMQLYIVLYTLKNHNKLI